MNKEIQDAMNQACKKSGLDASFGTGFEKGVKYAQENNKESEMLKRLMQEIGCCHVDMGSKHVYYLKPKAHKIISEIQAYLSDPNNREQSQNRI